MLLGGNYLGQSYIGGIVEYYYVRGNKPLIKDVIPSFRYTTDTYDDFAPYDAADTYDGSETVQDGFGNFAVVKEFEFPAPLVKNIYPSLSYSSSVYDEVSPYDDLDTYDGVEVVQTQSSSDILFSIEP